MKAVTFALAILCFVATAPLAQAASRDELSDQSAPLSLPDCPYTPIWVEPRDTLSGSYLGNGWEHGFLIVLRLTAIDGSLQGFLIQSEIDEFGTEVQDTYTVTGIYDSEQISIRVDLFLETLTMVGTWTRDYLELTYTGASGDVSTNRFRPTDDHEALDLLEAWNDREPRNSAGDSALNALSKALQAIPYETDLVSWPQRFSAEQAANALLMPQQDSLSLLTFGWLASAELLVRPVENLPNQLNRFTVHVNRSLGSSFDLAGCAQKNFYQQRDFERVENPTFDLLLVKQFAGLEGILGNTEVLAISGATLITATVYGTDEVRGTAIDTVTEIAANL